MTIHRPTKQQDSQLTETFLSRRQLAERWGVSQRTVKRREDLGVLAPLVLSSNIVRYRLSEILEIETEGTLTRSN